MRSKFRNWTSLLPTLTALVVLLLATGVCANLMRGFRVFSHGENLWSKSEKQIQIDLLRFSYSRDPLLLADAAKNLEVLEGDRIARVQLDSRDPDYQTVFAGFLQGGNAPEDIASAIRDYRLFKHTQALSGALKAWRDSDSDVDELRVCLSKLAALGAVDSGHQEATAIGNRLMRIDKELTKRQRIFSETMNYESNQAEAILLISNAAAGAFFFIVAGMVSQRLTRRLMIVELRDLALRRANDELETRVLQRTEELETEILDRKQTEKELQCKTAFLEAQGDATEDAILVVDGKGDRVFRNKQFVQLLNIPMAIAVARSDAEQLEYVLGLTKEPDKFLEKVKYLYAHPSETSRDEIELKSGMILDRYSSPVLGKNGEHYGRVWTFRDITEHKRAEKKLRESEERFRQVVEAAPIGIYIQTDGLFRYLNPAALAMFGAESADQMVGQRFLDLIHPDCRATVTERARFVEQERKAVVNLEVQRLRLDGSSFTGENSAVPFMFEDRDGAIVFFSDITERKRADAAMHNALESAAAANRAKSEFLANMSHEIRTPLNGVIGMTELALDSHSVKDQRDYLETIKSSGESLLAVINDILDFSKIEAGKMELEAFDFNLQDCLKGLLRPLGFRAEEKDIELLCDTDPDVPQILHGDSARLRQVILNLVSNAIKFTSIGKVSVRVGTEDAEEHSANLHFIVADTGIGIPLDKQKAIFSSFTQADASTTRKYGGTGLGLTICKRLVLLMGGTIWVESEVGRGSEFHFTVRMKESAGVVGQQITLPVETKAAAGPRLRILLAEDNRVNQVVATRMLEKMGHTVVIGGDGKEALSLFSQQCFDLILMDVQMPEMDGFVVTRKIRETEEHTFRAPIPIIAMTAHAMTGDRERCLDAGMDEYISKPITYTALEAAIASILPNEASRSAGTNHLRTSTIQNN